MEEKRMTERESLALISQMIQRTKDRVRIGDGNLLLLWGYVSVGVALAVYAALWLTRDPASNWLWLLIPIVGLAVQKIMGRHKPAVPKASTYVDRISAGIWQIVSVMAFFGMGTCLGFSVCGYGTRGWTAMLLYAFIFIGFGTAAQGIVLRERSLVCGGLFSLMAGGIVTCCVLSGIPLLAVWVLPLYIVSFTLMMIVPGHIINRKARRQCSAS